jgi:hypothetical protein
MTSVALPQCSTVYTGLDGPLGIVQTDQGNLLIAESGTPIPNTGRLSILDLAGNRRTLLSGLPSGVNDVGRPSGPAGLFLRGRTLYLTMGVGDASQAGPLPGTIVLNPTPSSPIFASVLALHFSSNVEVTTEGFALTLADQQTLAGGGAVRLSNGHGDQITIDLVANFPDYVPNPLPQLAANVTHSNPFSLVAVGERLYVTDGGRNRVWEVDLPTGTFRTLAEFSNVANPLFPAVGGPFQEAVPTGIAYSEGRLLVTLFRGFPFAQNTAVVEQVDPRTGSHGVLLTGLNSAVDILPLHDRANTSYLVLLHASFGPFFGGPGQVLRVAGPNSPGVPVTNCLTLPTSMALDAKTDLLYVTELGGRIVAVRMAP